MRRDMDMIREILLQLEDKGGYVEPRDFQLSGYDVKHDPADGWNFDYQLRILLDGGLIFAEFVKHKDKKVRGADDGELLTIGGRAWACARERGRPDPEAQWRFPIYRDPLA